MLYTLGEVKDGCYANLCVNAKYRQKYTPPGGWNCKLNWPKKLYAQRLLKNATKYTAICFVYKAAKLAIQLRIQYSSPRDIKLILQIVFSCFVLNCSYEIITICEILNSKFCWCQTDIFWKTKWKCSVQRQTLQKFSILHLLKM